MAGSIEPLREYLSERPDDAEARYLYGRALALTQRPHLATFSLRKAMEDPEWLMPAATHLAHAALEARDFNTVVEITGRILEREPDDVAALLMRANAVAHWKNDPERALADANRALELMPNQLEAYEPKILALVALGRREEAAEALAEAGRLLTSEPRADEDLAWHCVTTATLEQEAGQIDRARETFERCLVEHPVSPDALWSAVKFHDSQRARERSLEILRSGIERMPNAYGLRVELARRLRAKGEVEAAEAVLKESGPSESPRDPGAWAEIAKLRQSTGDHAAAAEALGRAVELARAAGSLTPQLEFAYADSLALAGRLDEALEVAEGLSVPAQQRMIRARVAQLRREPARALEEFSEALRLWPDNAWGRYYAALAAEELGDFERAIEEYRYSIRIAAEATDARVRAAELLLAENKPRLAQQLLGVNAEEKPLPVEGQLLALRLMGLLGDVKGVYASLERLGKGRAEWIGRAAAHAAEGVARRAGPGAALEMLRAAPAVDFTKHTGALRALVRFAHEAGEPAVAESALEAALAAYPQAGALYEIRGFQLELSGAPREAVRADYERALELDPGNPFALAGLGRLAVTDDPEGALGWFDRAAASDPTDAEAKLGAARALLASGKPEQAAERLDALLLVHPLEARAAAERARLDLERGIATDQTLERARRAVRFGGGEEARELLERATALRGEPIASSPPGGH